MKIQNEKKAPAAQQPARRAWVAPAVSDLPKLTELTLQTGFIPGDGSTVGGGSTVIP